MKKSIITSFLLYGLFLVTVAFFVSCKKDEQQKPVITPPPVATDTYYTVSITNLTPTLGSVTPTTATVKAGGVLNVNFLTDSGTRVSSAVFNGKPMVVSNNTLTLSNLNADLAGTVVFTDSLTSTQMSSSISLLTSGKLYLNGYYWRATGPLHVNDPWQPYPIVGDSKNYYDLFYANNTGEEYAGAISTFTWSLDYNGKGFSSTDASGTKKFIILTFNKNQFTYVSINDDGKGKDLKISLAPTKLP